MFAFPLPATNAPETPTRGRVSVHALVPSFAYRCALAWMMLFLIILAAPSHAQSVASVACIPTVISGGSGGKSTCVVRLSAPAPASGAAVTLGSSLSALAASVPKVTVPSKQSTATFTVVTNARYRQYSGLAFGVVVSATRGATVTSTLNITAQSPPADFSSGVGPGDQYQWQGKICGRIGPIGGNAEILYHCDPATMTAFGTCTFQQECSAGCRRTPPTGVVFNDSCPSAGPNPVALGRSYAVGGARVPAILVTERPVGVLGTQGMPGAISNQGVPGDIGGVSVNASQFPHDGSIPFPKGSSTADFAVATSVVPETTFIDVVGQWWNAASNVITNGRTGHAWLTIVPPESPPPLPIPTLGDFKVTGTNPVTGGQPSIGQIDVSGISSGGGPTISLSSSHPHIASLPTTFVMPASTALGQQVAITTQPPTVDTVVTLTATDGPRSFSTVLTVLAVGPGPLLSAVSVSPTSVTGGTSATGTVTLSVGAPLGGVVVALSTPLPNIASIPPNVTVPAGASSVSFAISTVRVAETFSVNIFADLAGTSRQALLMVTPR